MPENTYPQFDTSYDSLTESVESHKGKNRLTLSKVSNLTEAKKSITTRSQQTSISLINWAALPPILVSRLPARRSSVLYGDGGKKPSESTPLISPPTTSNLTRWQIQVDLSKIDDDVGKTCCICM